MSTNQESAHFLGSLFSTENGIFCVDPRDQFVAKSLIEQSHYGLHELNRLFQLTNAQSSVLMLGPHIGALAVPLSKKIKNLIVVEANPDTHRLLLINLLLNGCSNVEAFHAAANDTQGEIEFVMNTVNSGGSKRMPVYKDEAYFYDQPDIQSVPAVKLDELLPGQNFDLIFMDIEGSEYFAMKGMPNLITKCKILIAEFLPHHLSRVGSITVNQFLEPLKEFQSLLIPSLGQLVQADQFLTSLSSLFDQGHGDEGLIFFKEKMTQGINASTFIPADSDH